MEKGIKIITAVLAVAAIISGVVFFASSGDKMPEIIEKEPVVYSFEQSEYTTSANLSVKGADLSSF